MCGLDYRWSHKQAIAEPFAANVQDFELPDGYNVTPQFTQPVVRVNRDTGEPSFMLRRVTSTLAAALTDGRLIKSRGLERVYVVALTLGLLAIPNNLILAQKDPMVGGSAMYPTKNIIQNAIDSKDHTTLVAAVKAAGLVDKLAGPGPFTVFAPTNEAFAKLPAGTVDDLVKPEDKDDLIDILNYHVVPGRISSKDLKKMIKEGDGEATLKTVQGEDLTASIVDGKLVLTDAQGGISTVTVADVFQSNGVIHVIDTVLLPRQRQVRHTEKEEQEEISALRQEQAKQEEAQREERVREQEEAINSSAQAALDQERVARQAADQEAERLRELSAKDGAKPPAQSQQSADHESHLRTPAPVKPSEYALGEELRLWRSGLKNGAVEYRVPSAMIAQQSVAVTVKIHGYQNPQDFVMPDRTGSESLKVSSRMKAELIAPLNPGEFTIVPQGNDAIQFIPNDGFATWGWNVTPNYEGKQQQLQVRISLVHRSESDTLEDVLEEKTYLVDVDVQPLVVTVKRAFWKDPLGWFKTGWGQAAALATSLGGIGGLVAWLKTRKKGRKPSRAKTK